jgi:hypothetical protein
VLSQIYREATLFHFPDAGISLSYTLECPRIASTDLDL